MAQNDGLQLEQQQDEAINEYLTLKPQAATDAKVKRQLSRLVGKLDEVYWLRLEQLIRNHTSLAEDRLNFSDDDRLLIDMGFLDQRLVEGADDDLTTRLLDELTQTGSRNHYYFSEWLEERFRRYCLTQAFEADDTGGASAKAEGKNESMRRSVYKRLLPLFDGLPGLNKDLVQAVLTGKLEEQLFAVSEELMLTPIRQRFQHRHHLLRLREQVLEKAKARTQDETALKLFDALDELYVREWRERFRKLRDGDGQTQAAAAAAQAQAALTQEKAVEYLISEMRFVKTLLPIGALAGGQTRSPAVMLTDEVRVTKADTRRVLQTAEMADRAFHLNSIVLLAPFCGRGIFEWDRDSFVIPLRPSQGADDAVANAAGNYRMLIDSFQAEGLLRKQYQAVFPDATYQQAFQADYRTWVTGVAAGEAGCMEEGQLGFFLRHVGPEIDKVIAPADLRTVSPQTRSLLMKGLEKQIAQGKPDAKVYQRLAALYWQEGKIEQALKEIAKMVKAAPQDGMGLFSLATLLRAMGESDRAMNILSLCVERAPASLWTRYAQLLLEGKEALFGVPAGEGAS